MVSLPLSMALVFSSHLLAADVVQATDKGQLQGAAIFEHYGLNKDLPKLAMSSLLQGEHFVEHVKRSIKIGDTINESQAFLIKHTDDKGNINLRIKYDASKLDNDEDVIDEITHQARLEYRLRDYAQSYDKETVEAIEHDKQRVTINFDYSKYGLPQDIAYFRHLKVSIELQDGQPKTMKIFNDTPFKFGKYQIQQYRQLIHFTQQQNGEVIVTKKEIQATGSAANKPLHYTSTIDPVALYKKDAPTLVLNAERLREVSDPRMQEKRTQLNRMFPLMGDMVRRKGIDLPLPFGVSMTYRNQDMNIPFNDFTINGVRLNDIFSPEGSLGSVTAESISVRGDINILPFWNMFAYVGQIDVDAVVDAQYTGSVGNNLKDKLNDKLPGLGNKLCESVSALCQQSNFDIPLHLEYDLMGVGTTLSVGYKEFFGSVTGSYSQTRLKGTDDWSDGLWTVQPMLGYQFVEQRAQLFFGAEYQGLDPRLSGHVKLDELEFDYDVGVEIKKWAYMVGFNKQIGKNYNVSVLYNKGASRDALTLNVGYRF